MSKPLSVAETARMANELNAASAQLQEASAALHKDAEKQKGALGAQLDNELKKLVQEYASKRQAAQNIHQERVARLEEKQMRRERRILTAHASASKKALQAIDEKENRAKFSIQKGMLDAERGAEARSAQTEKDFEAFQHSVEEERKNLFHLQRRIRGAFSGLWGYRRLLSAPSTSPQPPAESGHKALLEQAVAQPVRKLALADDHGGYRGLAHADIEAEVAHAALEVAGVVPQAVDKLRLGLQHVDGRDTRADDGGR